MAVAFTVAVGSDYKSITVDITSLTGGTYTSTLYVIPPGETSATSLGVVTATSYTFYYHSGGTIDTTSTSAISFPDGVWEFYIYEIDSVAPFTEATSDSVYGFTSGYARCCLGTKIGKLSENIFNECCCSERYVQELFAMYIMIDSATFDASVTCADYSKAQKKIDMVNEFCLNDDDCQCSDCNDCN